MGLLTKLERSKRAGDYSATYGYGAHGGFAGGAVSRLTATMATWSAGINSDLDASLVILRSRARQLAQNNEHGKRFLTMVATNIVGAWGPKLQVRALMQQPAKDGRPQLDKIANDAIEVHWDSWCENAEITQRMDFALMCRVAAKAVARDGEALVRLVRNKDLPYGIALQLLEADRLDENLNVVFANGGAIRQGVEIDSTGRPVAYHIKASHPGERFQQGFTAAPERVPAAQIRHLFLPERAEQVRGHTWFHAVIIRSGHLHNFNNAAVVAAEVGASKIAAIERPDNSADLMPTMADGQTGNGAALQMNVEAGEMFELPPGYKLSSWNPEYPHANYESFVKAAMRGIAAGLDVATHNLSGDMTDVNYSSARIAEGTEQDQWMTLQAWFIRALPKWAFNEWLATALLRGDITFPMSGKSLPADKLSKFRDAASFQGRRWRSVDPVKDMKAARDALELKLTSRTRLSAERGEDWEDVVAEAEVERDTLVAAGLPTEPAAPAAVTEVVVPPAGE